jgi:hypothetical protein
MGGPDRLAFDRHGSVPLTQLRVRRGLGRANLSLPSLPDGGRGQGEGGQAGAAEARHVVADAPAVMLWGRT